MLKRIIGIGKEQIIANKAKVPLYSWNWYENMTSDRKAIK